MPKKQILFIIILGLLVTVGGHNCKAISFKPDTEYETIEDFIGSVMNIIFVLGLAVTPIVIMIGIFYLMSSGGDASKVKTGQKVIMYGLIGFALIMLSRGIMTAIEYLFLGD